MGLISLIKNVAGTTFDSISSQIQDQYLEFFNSKMIQVRLFGVEKKTFFKLFLYSFNN